MINIEQVKRDIVEALRPVDAEKIILFGSYVYGTPNDDSDLDICIIEKFYESKSEEKRKIRKLLKKIRVPKDILLTYSEEYEFYKNECNSVYSDIDKKGEVLWKKSS